MTCSSFLAPHPSGVGGAKRHRKLPAPLRTPSFPVKETGWKRGCLHVLVVLPGSFCLAQITDISLPLFWDLGSNVLCLTQIRGNSRCYARRGLRRLFFSKCLSIQVYTRDCPGRQAQPPQQATREKNSFDVCAVQRWCRNILRDRLSAAGPRRWLADGWVGRLSRRMATQCQSRSKARPPLPSAEEGCLQGRQGCFDEQKTLRSEPWGTMSP